jgi:hypothetical protein
LSPSELRKSPGMKKANDEVLAALFNTGPGPDAGGEKPGPSVWLLEDRSSTQRATHIGLMCFFFGLSGSQVALSKSITASYALAVLIHSLSACA